MSRTLNLCEHLLAEGRRFHQLGVDDRAERIFASLTRLREIGYDGWVSLELMNPTLWKAKPVQVAEIGLTALERVLAACGLAS